MSIPAHRKQVEEAVARSLSVAGIKVCYHGMSLSAHASPEAGPLAEWVSGASRESQTDGFSFIGGNDMEDLAILVARGLHITGRAVRVYHLIRFNELLVQDRDYLEENLDKVGNLLLTHAGPSTPNEVIYTPREMRSLEWRLQDWMSEGGRLLLHSKFDMVPDRGWFSGDFLQRVATCNKVIREGRR